MINFMIPPRISTYSNKVQVTPRNSQRVHEDSLVLEDFLVERGFELGDTRCAAGVTGSIKAFRRGDIGLLHLSYPQVLLHERRIYK